MIENWNIWDSYFSPWYQFWSCNCRKLEIFTVYNAVVWFAVFSVLLQLAEQFLAEDSCLGLGHILPLQDLTLSNSCFNSVPCTSIALQLAMYYYSIQGYKLLHSLPTEDRNRERDLYLYPPNEVWRTWKLVCTIPTFSMPQIKCTVPKPTSSTLNIFDMSYQ